VPLGTTGARKPQKDTSNTTSLVQLTTDLPLLFEDTIIIVEESEKEMSTFGTVQTQVVGGEVDEEVNRTVLMGNDGRDLQLRQTEATNDAEKEAEEALDSILETTVHEVNLALCHDDDAVTAAVNAAASEIVVIDEIAVTAAVATTHNTEGMKCAENSQYPLTSEASTSLSIENNGAVQQQPSARTGRWSLDEKILFLYGLQQFGKGHWKKISMYVPDR
jgi:hypothetical protein